ncbi:hypothetical protein D3C76_1804770 [compost metagenome]
MLLLFLVVSVPDHAPGRGGAGENNARQNGELGAAGFQVFIQTHECGAPSSEKTIQAYPSPPA